MSRKIISLLSAFFIFALSVNPSCADSFVPGEVIVVVKETSQASSSASSSAVKAAALRSAESSFASGNGLKLVQSFKPVTVKTSASASSLNNVTNNTSALNETLSVIHLRSSSGESTNEMIARLKKDPRVVSVSPNWIRRLSDSAKTPNDPYYPDQWGLSRISMPQAWSRASGSRETIAVVMDTGIIYDHPDLAANMYSMPKTLADKMGLPADFVGSCGGWLHSDNASPIDAVPIGPGATDEAVSADINRTDSRASMSKVGDVDGHGTHCAGIIGAVGNNGVGISGVNWNVSLMAVNIFSKMDDCDGDGNPETQALDSDIIRAIDFVLSAKNAGANIRVVNMSFGGWENEDGANQEQNVMALKLRALNDADVICVIAAGNESQDLNSPKGKYVGKRNSPVCYRYDNIISVGASCREGDASMEDICADYSNYSSSGNLVDIFAPGTRIKSTYRFTPMFNSDADCDGSGYAFLSGTSMAAPLVTGAVALLCSIYPDESASEIKSMIMNNADGGVLKTGYSGYGLLNMKWLSDEENGGDGGDGGEGGSGGGCAAGFTFFALAALIPLAFRKKR